MRSQNAVLKDNYCWYCLCDVFLSFCHLYARKQLLLSAHFSHRDFVCPSVRPSHEWISQKWCKLESPNLHLRLPGRR